MRISIDLDDESIAKLDKIKSEQFRTRKLQVEYFVKRGLEEKLLQ